MHSAGVATHPVVDALRSPPPGARLALVVEGGGMRGAVSGGMVLALHELGLHGAFHAAYGSSAGSLNSMWLVSGRVPDGIATWVDPGLVHELIQPRRALRGGPVVDVETLVEKRYEELSPGLFAAVLASGTELHPIATDTATGHAVDLHGSIGDERSLRLALRASAALPVLAGGTVKIGGRRLLDAGLAAAIPFRAALDDGATHVLVLRSRRLGERAEAPGRLSGSLTAALLRRYGGAVARAFATRAEREGRDEDFLAERDGDPDALPHVLSIRPAAGSAAPSRLERDVGIARSGLEAGRVAALRALDPSG